MTAPRSADSKRQLSTLIRLQEKERDQLAKNLQSARQNKHHLEQTKSQLTEQRLQSANDRARQSQGPIALQQLVLSQRYEESLEQGIKELEIKLDEAERTIAALQDQLTASQQRLKSFERLRDQREQAEMKSTLIDQQQNLDQWSIIRHATSLANDGEV